MLELPPASAVGPENRTPPAQRPQAPRQQNHPSGPPSSPPRSLANSRSLPRVLFAVSCPWLTARPLPSLLLRHVLSPLTTAQGTSLVPSSLLSVNLRPSRLGSFLSLFPLCRRKLSNTRSSDNKSLLANFGGSGNSPQPSQLFSQKTTRDCLHLHVE